MDNNTTINILVADDDFDLAKIVMDNLNAEGFRVYHACDGVAAMAMIRARMPSLLILDINMPGKDGFEVLQEIRADKALAKLPVIFLTSRRRMQDQMAGLDLGADDYIIKPYDVEDLIKRVLKILKKYYKI